MAYSPFFPLYLVKNHNHKAKTGQIKMQTHAADPLASTSVPNSPNSEVSLFNSSRSMTFFLTMQPYCFPKYTQQKWTQIARVHEEHNDITNCARSKEARRSVCMCLTCLQPVHVLQPDDVPLVEVEQSPVLVDVVSHCHHVL